MRGVHGAPQQDSVRSAQCTHCALSLSFRSLQRWCIQFFAWAHGDCDSRVAPSLQQQIEPLCDFKRVLDIRNSRVEDIHDTATATVSGDHLSVAQGLKVLHSCCYGAANNGPCDDISGANSSCGQSSCKRQRGDARCRNSFDALQEGSVQIGTPPGKPVTSTS